MKVFFSVLPAWSGQGVLRDVCSIRRWRPVLGGEPPLRSASEAKLQKCGAGRGRNLAR